MDYFRSSSDDCICNYGLSFSLFFIGHSPAATKRRFRPLMLDVLSRLTTGKIHYLFYQYS